MRIVHLTAGTGHWHCGSCIRDDALVKALRTLGHDADLVPMYLPVVADGPSCSAHEPVLMGGVNTYLQQEVPLFRHLPRWMDAVLSTRPVLDLAGRFAGSTRPESLGAMTVSMLQGLEGNQHKEVERLLDALAQRPRPDVVVLSNSLLVGLAAPIRARLGVPVVCTIQGEMHFVDGLDEGSEAAWRFVAEGLRAVDGRVAVSRFAALAMAARTGLSPASFDVVHNGIDVEGYGPPAPPDGDPVLGYFARMYGLKGLHRVVEAFIALRARGLAVRLAVGGTLNPGDRPEVEAAQRRLREAGVAEHASFHPNLSPEAKRAFLRQVTVFSVPTAKDDTFGLYNLEAMASGVPVVAPARGALTEVVERAGGGVLVPGQDDGALVDALAALLADPAARARLGQAGAALVRERFTSLHMAAAMAEVLHRVVSTAAA